MFRSTCVIEQQGNLPDGITMDVSLRELFPLPADDHSLGNSLLGMTELLLIILWEAIQSRATQRSRDFLRTVSKEELKK
jgi:hypothetical protein